MRLLLLFLLVVGCEWTEEPETIVCEDDAHCPTDYWCPDSDGDATGLCTLGSRDPDGDGYGPDTDCAPDDPDIHPFADDPFDDDGIDTDCDGEDGQDHDGDGFRLQPFPGTDCDDGDPDIHPGADENCFDGIDSNCDGLEELDLDYDGHSACSGDCDDNDELRHPDQIEACNGIDENCDGVGDFNDPAFDQDGDSWSSCGKLGEVDCDDADPNVHPDATELCNGEDDDCDALLLLDEDDDDGDGALPCTGCEEDGPVVCGDCDDGDSTVHPGVLDEGCDGIDTDCDGALGDDESTDTDGDGTPLCDDCDDSNAEVWPGAGEACDGIDNDCDGVVPADEADSDGDSWPLCGDCDDTEATTSPSAPELCDGIDNDCSGAPNTDEVDDDGDSSLACDDCDDDNADRAPTLLETCDGIDNDCDGQLPADEADDDGDGLSLCAGDCDDLDPLNGPHLSEDCTDGQDNDCDTFEDECNEWVVFSSDRGDSVDSDLWITSLFDGTFIHLTALAGQEYGAVVSPDGTQVAFTYLAPLGSPEIWLLDLASLQVEPLTDGLCGIGVQSPDWHPEGTTLVADCFEDAGEHDIVEISLTGDVTTLFATNDDTQAAAWSWPVGGAIAENGIDGLSGNQVLRIRDFSGDPPTLLTRTDDAETKGGPEWRHDGQWIAYSSGGDDRSILRVAVDDSAEQELTTPDVGQSDESPRWSPDDSELVFERRTTAGHYDLWSVSFGGGDEAPLLAEATNSFSPDWALLPPGFEPGSMDGDGDGYPASEDCDDDNPDVSPAESEVCDGLDTDCDGVLPITEGDSDGDGWQPCDGDCDPGSSTVYPGAPEICDGGDSNCDGVTPTIEFDQDGDQWLGCDDCDDLDPTAYPGAPEVANNGIDEDCNGVDLALCVPVITPNGTQLSSVVGNLRGAGDADGDGDIDVATFLGGSNYGLLRSDGVGGFGLETIVSVGSGTSSIAYADLDGVNGPDIIHGRNNDGGGRVLLNNGAGTFSDAGIELGSSDRCNFEFTEIHPHDIDNDGDLDLVTSVDCGINVFRNDGGMNFVRTTDPSVTTGADRPRLDLLDVDGDGYDDIVAAINNGGPSLVLINDQAGSFVVTGGHSLPDTIDGKDVDAADLDGDGDLDVLITDYDAALPGLVIYAAINDGGTMTTGGSWTHVGAFAGAGELDVADFNGDGVPDFVIGGPSGGRVFHGDGDGGFAAGAALPSTRYPLVFDANDDGDPDVLAFDPTDGATLLLNDCQEVPDLDDWVVTGHWQFDEDEPDTVLDSGPWGMHTDAGGAELVEGRCGEGRQFVAAEVDQVVWNDGSAPAISGDDPVTIAAWFRLDALPTATWVEVFSYAVTSGGITHTLRWEVGGYPGWSSDDPTSFGDSFFSGTPLDVGGWHSIIGVYDPDTNYRPLYIDGQEVGASTATSSTGFGSGEGYLALGGFNPSDPNHILDATVDDAMVFNSALDIDQVGLIASMSCVTYPAQVEDADGDGFHVFEDCDDSDPTRYPGATELCDSSIDFNCDGALSSTWQSELVPDGHTLGLWHFEEGAGDTALDDGPIGQDAELFGTVWTVDGVFGGGVELDGSDDFIDSGTGLDISTEDSFSMEAWLFLDSATAGRQCILGTETGSLSPSNKTTVRWCIQSDRRMELILRIKEDTLGQGSTHSSVQFPVGRWTHARVAYNAGEVSMYLDGVLVGASTFEHVGSFLTVNPLLIGANDDSYSTSAPLKHFLGGRMDEVRISSSTRAPCSDETGTVLDAVAHYTYDGDLLDSSGHTLDQTDGGVSYDSAAPIGDCVLYESGNFGSIPAQGAIAIDTELTVAFWARRDGSADGEFAPVAAWSDPDGGDEGWFVGLQDSPEEVLQCSIFQAGNDGELFLDPLAVGTWKHIIFSYSNSDGLALYNNDVLLESEPSWTFGMTPSSSATVNFGGDPNGVAGSLNACIDDLWLFDRPLNERERGVLFTAGVLDNDGDGYELDDDCDDSDPDIHPGASEVVGDGIDQDCDGFDEVGISEGDVVLVEFMWNPLGNDDCGEYLEFLNTTSDEVDLDGWTIGRGASCTSLVESHDISVLVIPPLGRILLAEESGVPDCAATDSLLADYRYPRSDLSIIEESELMICNGTQEIDRVDLTAGNWPLSLNSGRSTGFSPVLDAALNDNNDPASWCVQTSDLSTTYMTDGTPGTVNDPC